MLEVNPESLDDLVIVTSQHYDTHSGSTQARPQLYSLMHTANSKLEGDQTEPLVNKCRYPMGIRLREDTSVC